MTLRKIEDVWVYECPDLILNEFQAIICLFIWKTVLTCLGEFKDLLKGKGLSGISEKIFPQEVVRIIAKPK